MTEYWDEDFEPADETFDQAVDRIEAAVTESVKAHSFADQGIKLVHFFRLGLTPATLRL